MLLLFVVMIVILGTVSGNGNLRMISVTFENNFEENIVEVCNICPSRPETEEKDCISLFPQDSMTRKKVDSRERFYIQCQSKDSTEFFGFTEFPESSSTADFHVQLKQVAYNRRVLVKNDGASEVDFLSIVHPKA